MKIHFRKVEIVGLWYAHESNVAYFHSSLDKRIRNNLKNIPGLIFYPSLFVGFIYFLFNDPADEAAFMMQMSNGLEIDL